MVSFLELLFCGKCVAKATALEKEVVSLKEDKAVLIRNYQNLMTEKLQLILDCGKDALELHNKIQELEQLIKQMEQEDLELFNWPKIPTYTYAAVDVSTVQEFYDVEFVRADAAYNLFSKADWVALLTAVHPLVKEALTRWVVDISDCDNWSTVMSAFVSIAFKKSGYFKQGAFAIAHTVSDESARHAYNLFVDLDRKVWLYEPQNNTLHGLMQDGEGYFRTGYVWFLV